MVDEREILCYDSGLYKRYESVPKGVVDDVIESRISQLAMIKKSMLVAMGFIGALSIVLHIVNVFSSAGVGFSMVVIALLTLILYLFPTEDQIKPVVVSEGSVEAISDDVQHLIQHEEVHNPPKRIMFDIVGERVYTNLRSILSV